MVYYFCKLNYSDMKEKIVAIVLSISACIAIIIAGAVMSACGIKEVGMCVVYAGAFALLITAIVTVVFVIFKTLEMNERHRELHRR